MYVRRDYEIKPVYLLTLCRLCFFGVHDDVRVSDDSILCNLVFPYKFSA